MSTTIAVASVEVEDVTATNKKASAELDVSALNPDADGDGNVSPLEREIYQALKAADIDGSGSIGVGELYAVIGNLVSEKRKVRSLSKLVAASSKNLMTAENVGVVIGPNILSKENQDAIASATIMPAAVQLAAFLAKNGYLTNACFLFVRILIC